VTKTAFPEVEASIATTDAAELKSRIDAGDPITVLDTRARDGFGAWHIEAPNVTSVNVPYFEFLDGLTEELEQQVPDTAPGEPIYVVCAKGSSSEFVAELLAEAGYEATNLGDGMRGWARLYEHTDLTLPDGTLVRQYRRPSSGCLAYLLVSDGEAAVIDPLRAFTDRYLEDVATLDARIEYVLDTHVHADHVSGVRELADAASATAVLPRPAAERGIVDADEARLVDDGDVLSLGATTLSVEHTPGHTSGGTSYLVADALAVTGDTLFLDGVARPDLEAGAEGADTAAETLYDTIHERLLALPRDTPVGPAHFGQQTDPREDGSYLATVGELADSLELLGLDRTTFVERVLADMPPRPANYRSIIDTNLGRTSASDEEAFTMELGPNNCAAGE
jgi:glyoxylase-like metal-dependent hydrolase (beta-lactamase superfamily II)/rhodanese-related sulfurtransferase